MIIWKKKSINLKLQLPTWKSIKTFNILVNICGHIVWSVQNYRMSKSKRCREKNWKNNAFIKMWLLTSGLLNSLGIKTDLSKTPLLSPLFFLRV